jgi:uroporphyrinogen-III decarboxylase
MAEAMARRVPDRVPVMCQMSVGHMLLQTGFPPSELWFSAEIFAEALLRLREIYGFDGILVSLHGHSPDWSRDVLSIDRDEAGETVRWKNGDRTVFPADDLPLHVRARESPRPDIASLDPDALPDRIGFIPVSQGLEFRLDPDHLFDAVDIVRARAGETFSVHGEITSPFDYFLNLVGFREGFLALVDEPDRSKAVLDRYAEGLTRLARGLAGRGVDALKISSPFAGAGFISPACYREFVVPYEARIAAAARDAGVFAYTHTCGAVHDRLELMAEAGVAGIECLDPPPLGTVDLADAKRRVGGRLFIKGNLDPVHVLLRGTEADVEREARRCLEAGSPGGGYILSTACSVAPRTSRLNLQVLARAAEEWGRRASA